jgi:hypothetical protein
MPQRDFILRIIEQLGAVLAELRRRILGGGDAGAVDEALTDAADQAGFDLTLLRGFTVESLHMFVASTGEVEPARCWLMAEVLYLDGLQASLEGRAADARDGLIKARSLYDLVRPAGGMIVGLPEAAERIAEIDERLRALPEE